MCPKEEIKCVAENEHLLHRCQAYIKILSVCSKAITLKFGFQIAFKTAKREKNTSQPEWNETKRYRFSKEGAPFATALFISRTHACTIYVSRCVYMYIIRSHIKSFCELKHEDQKGMCQTGCLFRIDWQNGKCKYLIHHCVIHSKIVSSVSLFKHLYE